MQRVQSYQFPRRGYRIAVPPARAASRARWWRDAARYLADAVRYRHAAHAAILALVGGVAAAVIAT